MAGDGAMGTHFEGSSAHIRKDVACWILHTLHFYFAYFAFGFAYFAFQFIVVDLHLSAGFGSWSWHSGKCLDPDFAVLSSLYLIRCPVQS